MHAGLTHGNQQLGCHLENKLGMCLNHMSSCSQYCVDVNYTKPGDHLETI